MKIIPQGRELTYQERVVRLGKEPWSFVLAKMELSIKNSIMYETLCVELKERACVEDKGKLGITVLGTPEPKLTRQHMNLHSTGITMPECQALDSQAFLSTAPLHMLFLLPVFLPGKLPISHL